MAIGSSSSVDYTDFGHLHNIFYRLGSGPNISDKAEQRQVVLELLKHEGDLYWQTYQAYLIAQTILAGFIAVSSWSSSSSMRFLIALLGLFFCLLWYASNRRNAGYYKLRMQQAKSIEPDTWETLNGKGERFAEGEKVEILPNKPIKMAWCAQLLRTNCTSRLLIFAFVLFYLYVLCANSPALMKLYLKETMRIGVLQNIIFKVLPPMLMSAGSIGMIVFATKFPLSSAIEDLKFSKKRFLGLNGYYLWILSWSLIIAGAIIQLWDGVRSLPIGL